MENPNGLREGRERPGKVSAWFSKKVFIAVGIILLMILPLLWLGQTAEIFLLFLMAILLSLVMRGLGDWMAKKTGWHEKLCLSLVLIVLLGAIASAAWYLAPEISEQVQQMQKDIPKAANHAFEQAKSTSWGENLLGDVSFNDQMKETVPKMLAKAGNILSISLTIITYTVLVAFVALYLAFDPCTYVNGLVSLFPQSRRKRTREVMATLGRVLRREMIGRLFLMLINAVITSLTLWALGIPLALTLGLFTGLMNFVPNIGPVIASIPALLMALMQGTDKALYVAIFYIAYQMIDGYILTPIVQKKAVSLAPAITIMAQVLLGITVGPMGVLLAVPICAILLVLVKLLYMEDVLGEKADLPGE
ncbi:MAG: AI-2E family transporter [Verrucomicrobiales bacterium]